MWRRGRIYLHANIECSSQKDNALWQTLREHFPQNTCLESLAPNITDPAELRAFCCANIHRPHALFSTINVTVYKMNTAEITAAQFSWIYPPHTRQTQRSTDATKNAILRRTRAVHLMIISGSSANGFVCAAGQRKWCSRICSHVDGN